MFSCEFCKISKNTYSYRTPPLAASECSRNLGFEKQTDQNLSHKISVTERNIAFQRKINFKQSQKEVIYEYILAFEGWWSIFWKVVGSGGYILAGNGWWWVVAA